jgi:hypothetical protein
MKPQTADNLRCLAAAVLLFVVLIGAFTWQPAWLAWLPQWMRVAGFVVVLFLVVRLFNFRPSAKPDRVRFDDTVITRTLPDGKTETVQWNDLREVGILTTDEGPVGEDVFWMLLGASGGCAIPSGAQGMKELLTRLQQLPEFDNEAVIKAMGTTTNGKFVCWKLCSEEGK